MKRKKWSEAEEKTLLTKYLELLNSGTLGKLITREKKLKPIAEHVNSVHHLQDCLSYPFEWSWRDLSIKVQNMRHQYLGVKQKIQISNNNFNWSDAENHWENFSLYKKVFGDVDLSEPKSQIHNINVQRNYRRDVMFNDEGFMGLRYRMDSEETEDGSEGKEDEEAEMVGDDVVVSEGEFIGGDKGDKEGNGEKRLSMMGEQLLELQGMMVRREEKRRRRECSREEKAIGNDHRRKERQFRKEIHDSKRDEELEERDIEFEDRQIMLAKKEYERRVRLEKELDEERRRRMKLEEKLEEEEMQWREMMVGIQFEHEKQMMQLHMDACENQMHVLGFITRMWCQFFGYMNDGLAGGLGTLPPQVMQNMHDAGNIGGNEKPDSSSPSQFL